MALYYSVLIPFTAKNPTKWHPTEAVGPFSTLTRGAFKTYGEAEKWAQENLEGHAFAVLAADDGIPSPPPPGPDLTDHPEWW